MLRVVAEDGRVSTRSRPKAAGKHPHSASDKRAFQHAAARRRLADAPKPGDIAMWFQHAAARRRLDARKGSFESFLYVSTRSRPKAAGSALVWCSTCPPVSTRSRPKAAGPVLAFLCLLAGFQHAAARRRLGFFRAHRYTPDSFNTQPPEGGWKMLSVFNIMDMVSTRSRPKAAGSDKLELYCAARVSTRSRPKAAGSCGYQPADATARFNTQPPEGGWHLINDRAFRQ